MDTVEREKTQVLYLAARDFPNDISTAWEQLESRFESLRGRKFVGAFYPDSNEYRACVEVRPGDDPAELSLEEGRLPGGTYARVRLKGEPPALYAEIGPAFDELSKRADSDPTRPSLELYRRRDEVDCLLPVMG